MGHLSRDAGQMFEDEIEVAIQSAQQQRIVRWYAHQEPRKTMSGHPIAQSGADFIGFFFGGAVSFAIECKSTTDKDGVVRIYKDEFTVEQQRNLIACSEEGGLSLGALRFWHRRSGQMQSFMIPWHLIPWQRAKTRLFIEPGAIDPHWTLPMANKIAAYVRQCPRCSAWAPKAALHDHCCYGALPF